MGGPSIFKQLSGISSVGAAVEFSWAAGESVLVPYLKRHGVPDWLVSTAYLANPTLGLYVQPMIGAWSDRLNKRVPFVLGLTGIALLGMILLMSAVPIAAALGLTSTAAVATVSEADPRLTRSHSSGKSAWPSALPGCPAMGSGCPVSPATHNCMSPTPPTTHMPTDYIYFRRCQTC